MRQDLRGGLNQVHDAGWTPERETKLRELWDGGVTARDIAEQMGGGLTRNGVLGKAHRLKLTPRPKPEPKPKKIEAKRAHNAKRTRRIPSPEFYEFAADVWEPLPGTTPISLLDLNDTVCRWPVGGTNTTRCHGFCGCPTVPGSVYCEEHTHRKPVRKAVKDADVLSPVFTQPTELAA